MSGLDSIDSKIIEMLFEDGRKSASFIAEKVGLSVPATADRIKKLQDSGVIKSFRPILDSKKIGLDVTAFITVYSESSKNFEKVVLNASKNPTALKAFLLLFFSIKSHLFPLIFTHSNGCSFIIVTLAID